MILLICRNTRNIFFATLLTPFTAKCCCNWHIPKSLKEFPNLNLLYLLVESNKLIAAYNFRPHSAEILKSTFAVNIYFLCTNLCLKRTFLLAFHTVFVSSKLYTSCNNLCFRLKIQLTYLTEFELSNNFYNSIQKPAKFQLHCLFSFVSSR